MKINKQNTAAIVLVIAAIAIMAYTLATLPDEHPVARNVNAPKTPYTVCYHEMSDITVDTPYLLIDLSNATDWPHSATNAVIIKDVTMQGVVSGSHHWHLTIGTVVENDATNGTAVWIVNQHLATLTGIFAPPQRTWSGDGLSLRVADDDLVYGVANGHSELTSWQSDTAISATVGTTGTVAAGDLVLLADEHTDGSTFNFTVCVDYDTE